MDSVEYLRTLATQRDVKDWDYTRLHSIDRIEYVDGPNWRTRLLAAFHAIFHFPWHKDEVAEMLGFSRWHLYTSNIKSAWEKKRHLPNGVLANGQVITYWEEDGEYLQLVRPSVGVLIADWLEDDPDNPHAIKVREELERIIDRYDANIREGKVDGVRQG